jgi:hypothetical protein
LVPVILIIAAMKEREPKEYLPLRAYFLPCPLPPPTRAFWFSQTYEPEVMRLGEQRVFFSAFQ